MQYQIYLQEFFNENFEMYPISAKRMIVEISPFYKFRQMYAWRYEMPELDELTELVNEDLFASNSVIYEKPQTSTLIPRYSPHDIYIYEVKNSHRRKQDIATNCFWTELIHISAFRRCVRQSEA